MGSNASESKSDDARQSESKRIQARLSETSESKSIQVKPGGTKFGQKRLPRIIIGAVRTTLTSAVKLTRRPNPAFSSNIFELAYTLHESVNRIPSTPCADTWKMSAILYYILLSISKNKLLKKKLLPKSTLPSLCTINYVIIINGGDNEEKDADNKQC